MRRSGRDGSNTRWRYPKIGIKQLIIVILGALLGIGSARQPRSGEPVPAAIFDAVGALSLLSAEIAVIW